MTSPNGATGPVGYERGDVPVRPPLLLGCGVMLGVLVLIVMGGACAIVFFESGADSGKVQLEDADAYAPGSITYNGDFNFFIVRATDGEFMALDNLDAANRAAEGRRCRVQAVPPGGRDSDELIAEYQGAMSPQGRALGIILREDCNGAVYDGTGLRLDAPGARNLDRFATSETATGRLEVSRGERLCSQRQAGNLYTSVECE